MYWYRTPLNTNPMIDLDEVWVVRKVSNDQHSIIFRNKNQKDFESHWVFDSKRDRDTVFEEISDILISRNTTAKA